jgi:hypothetical protein
VVSRGRKRERDKWQNVAVSEDSDNVFCLCPQIQSLENELRRVRELRRRVSNTDS